MAASDFIKRGDLAGAIKAAEDEVRNNPAAGKSRVLLFQLSAVDGHWDRAITQLDVAGRMEAKNLLMAQVCRQLILCEKLRGEVFDGKRSPLLLGEPETWVAQMVQAMGLTSRGEHAAAAKMRADALEAAPAVGGTIKTRGEAGGTTSFEWLADADSRIGPMLELMVDAKYYWAPMSRLKEIKFEAPADLRDLLWMPATFVWATGATQEGFVPARYAGTEKAGDAALKLCRKTEWNDLDGGTTFAGIGQKMLASDAGDTPLLEIESISFAVDVTADGGGAGVTGG